MTAAPSSTAVILNSPAPLICLYVVPCTAVLLRCLGCAARRGAWRIHYDKKPFPAACEQQSAAGRYEIAPGTTKAVEGTLFRILRPCCACLITLTVRCHGSLVKQWDRVDRGWVVVDLIGLSHA